MNWWSSQMIVFPDLGKQVSSICSVCMCMWVDGEPENQGNIQQVAMSGLMFYIRISQMLLYI